MGAADLSCASLEALARDAKFQIAAVVTHPDHPKGRGLKLQPSPVKSLALQLSLPVLQPSRVRDEKFIAELRALQPDLIIVVAYGQILPPAISTSRVAIASPRPVPPYLRVIEPSP